jgi:hypothetical protein
VSKKAKVALFLLAATILNIASTALLFIGFLALYSFTLGKILPQAAIMWAVVGSFILSLVGTVLLYKFMLSYARKKFDLDGYLGISGVKPKN